MGPGNKCRDDSPDLAWPVPHSLLSLPGLTRQSISMTDRILRVATWTLGSSPRVTDKAGEKPYIYWKPNAFTTLWVSASR